MALVSLCVASFCKGSLATGVFTPRSYSREVVFQFTLVQVVVQRKSAKPPLLWGTQMKTLGCLICCLCSLSFCTLAGRRNGGTIPAHETCEHPTNIRRTHRFGVHSDCNCLATLEELADNTSVPPGPLGESFYKSIPFGALCSECSHTRQHPHPLLFSFRSLRGRLLRTRYSETPCSFQA